MTDLVGNILVTLLDLMPQLGIILLTEGKEACFRAIARNPPKLLRALCRIPQALHL
jgi:hypothetical protein